VRVPVIWLTVGEELCMGFRPTYMDENWRERGTIERARNGEGRAYSGLVEAVEEFGLGCVLWTNLYDACHLGMDW